MVESEVNAILERLSEFEKRAGERMDNIDKKLDSYHENTVVLNTVILGKNGDAGLVGKVDDNCKETGSLKLKFWMLIGLLMGSGLLGGLGIAQLIGG